MRNRLAEMADMGFAPLTAPPQIPRDPDRYVISSPSSGSVAIPLLSSQDSRLAQEGIILALIGTTRMSLSPGFHHKLELNQERVCGVLGSNFGA
jgi:hypothetical protein